MNDDAEPASKTRRISEDGTQSNLSSNQLSAEEMKMKTKEILEEIQNTKSILLSTYKDEVKAIFARLITDFRLDPDAKYPFTLEEKLDLEMGQFIDDVYPYEEDLKSSGATAETLTMDQWRAQLLRFCPSVLRVVKLLPVVIAAYHLNRDLVTTRKNFQEDVAKQQILELADYVLSEGGFIVPIVFCVLHISVINNRFSLLTSLVSYHAFLLLLELIVKCVDSSESSEVMMNTVKQEIEDGFLLQSLEYESKLLADNKDLWERMVAEHTNALLDEDQDSTLGD